MKLQRIYFLAFTFLLIFSACSPMQEREFVCGQTIGDFEKNKYETVEIFNDCWMKQNLKSNKDRQGLIINNICYNEDQINCDVFGSFYPYEAVFKGYDNEKNFEVICPPGWHIPKEEEIVKLMKYLSGDNECSLDKSCSVDANLFAQRENNINLEYAGSCDLVCDYQECNNKCFNKECKAVYLFKLQSLDSVVPVSRLIIDKCEDETIIETIKGGIDSFMSVRCVKN